MVSDAASWKQPTLTAAERERLSGHRGAVVWFTGLSASGKTTVARALDRRLHDAGRRSFLMDGDALRTGLTQGLGFSERDRTENLRRFTEVARLFAESGTLALVSAIAPYEVARQRAKERIGADRFLLVHVATPLSVCEARDPKGMYRRARAGELKQFTGIDSPYEEPVDPDLKLTPEDGDPGAQVEQVWSLMGERGFFSPTSPA